MIKSTENTYVAHLGDGIYRVARRRGRSAITGRFIVANPEVTISMDEYLGLQEDRRWRQSLESAGVDNWSGYDSAMEMFDDSEL